MITAALSEGYGGANVPASTFAAYDWINIMAYDATGPWAPNNPGQHSPYSMAVNQFNYWTGRGLPASKAIIGLPFYGYGFGANANQGISYANIVAQYPGAENQDQVGNTIYYNGIPTIKQKTTFAIQNAAGVMIWELSQDTRGSIPNSLLTQVDTSFGSIVPGTVSIGGSVKNGTALVTNVTVEIRNASNVVLESVVSPTGNFTFYNLAKNQNYTLTAIKTAYTFTPVSLTNVAADQTGVVIQGTKPL